MEKKFQSRWIKKLSTEKNQQLWNGNGLPFYIRARKPRRFDRRKTREVIKNVFFSSVICISQREWRWRRRDSQLKRLEWDRELFNCFECVEIWSIRMRFNSMECQSRFSAARFSLSLSINPNLVKSMSGELWVGIANNNNNFSAELLIEHTRFV